MDIVKQQREEILRLEEVIRSMRSEIHYAVHSKKTEEVKNHYLENAIKYADEAIKIN